MARTVVSYDDLVERSPAGPSIGPQVPLPTGPPPAKKRKRTHQNQNNGRGQQQQQHWDDPGQPSQHVPYDTGSDELIATEADEVAEDGEVEEDEESRVLTQDEIWDDSALIEAWESATAEYEAYHGKGKAWKEHPVKKSPLWYNVPPSASAFKKSLQPSELAPVAPEASVNGDGENSHPLNFETFVPYHDPTLALPNAGANGYQLVEPPGARVSRDEAFNRALSAMYWTGYWTAVYHSHNNPDEGKAVDGQDEDMDGEYAEEVDAEDAMEDELVSTQR